MRYYLIKENEEFKIMKVKNECVDKFLIAYSDMIVFASGCRSEIVNRINEFSPLAYKVRKASEEMRTLHEYRFCSN